MSRTVQTFAGWLKRNKAKTLQRKGKYEVARFEAQGVLCIIYKNSSDKVTKFNCETARDAWEAFSAKRPMDCRSYINTPIINHWRQRAKAFLLTGKVREGSAEPINLRAYARANRMTIRVIVCIGVRNGLVVRGMYLKRAEA